MKRLATVAGVAAVGAMMLLAPSGSYAQAKACEELKTEIAQKLDAKGVKGYTLEIVAKDADAADGKVVGTCEGGTKKIVYRRGGAASPAKEESKPQS